MHFTKRHKLRAQLMSGATFAAVVVGAPAWAQDVGGDVVVTGTRQVIQSTIAIKRSNTQIVDGLSASEIGDLPALSIGEALETITGASSHRENGGATEISIRGLGPFLSSTVVNGREATNGGGDRSVNFSQFPSELVSKLAIFKTQSASQIEGGVAGQIQLETLRPLDHGKRRIQFEIKGNLNPDQLNQDDTLVGDIGYRGTVSYVDQFDLGGLGDFGISVGGQISSISQPEAEARSTSSGGNSRPACLITDGLAQFTDQTNGGTFTGFSNNPETTDRGDDDCDDFNDRRNADNLDTRGSDVEGVDTSIDPDTGLAIDDGVPFVFAPSQRSFRQNDTEDERDAFFGAIQWQPNDRIDINADLQWSERTQSELRNDLVFNGGRFNDTDFTNGNSSTSADDISINDLPDFLQGQTTLDLLEFTPSGAITSFTTENTIELQGGDFEREETYLGGGLNGAYRVSDRLTLSADLSYSETERTEQAIEYRLQSDATPVYTFDNTGGTPTYTLAGESFDVNDHGLFVDRLRIRIDNDLDRENTSIAARFDAEYEADFGPVSKIQAGFRASELEYLALDGGNDDGTAGRIEFEFRTDGFGDSRTSRTETDNNFDALIATSADSLSLLNLANSSCQTSFNEDDFLGSVRDGDLITNIDANGLISSTNSYATFDVNCLANLGIDHINEFGLATDPITGEVITLTNGLPGLVEENQNTIDVTEDTIALYAMADYESEIAGLPVRGNFGLRVINTSVDSTGYRNSFSINEDDFGVLSISANDDITQVDAGHDYTEFLPSITTIVDIDDETLLRFGVFRALSRADPSDMGFSRDILVQNSSEGEDITEADELVADVTAQGNPELEPLTSWNFDAGFEHYPNKDTIIALGGYYKRFRGGFENVVQDETFSIGGELVSFPVEIQQTNDDSSNLYGVEFTGAHTFSWLPGYWSGLGVKASYNYATSDFDFEDSRYGDQFTRDVDGSLTQTAAGIIAPANIPGLSKHVFSGQVFYQIGALDLQGIYKYRSEYFQPFTDDGTRIRYVGDTGVFEARGSYKINNNYRLSVEAINLFSEPREQFAFVGDDRYEINDYGPRVFFGLRGRF